MLRRSLLSLTLTGAAAGGMLLGPAAVASAAPASATTATVTTAMTTARSTGLLNVGARGSAVQGWQQALNAWRTANGQSAIAVDGIYGPQTKAATEDFQRAAGIVVDGVVGPQTRGAISGAAGGPTSSGSSTSSSGSTSNNHPLLREGDHGAAVKALKQRLESLNFWTGGVDDNFGPLTQQAVWAFQKVAGITVDGIVGPHTWAKLDAGTQASAQSTSGRVVEIDLEAGVTKIVTDGHVDEVFNSSAGGGYKYQTQAGKTVVAQTPKGHFQILWQIDGMHHAPLGDMWRPKYFVGGEALHGEPTSAVPPTAASHGCDRVSKAAMDWIWNNNEVPLGTPVWVY